ncbi:UDP-glucose/GDP-mannose dehydrogenase family protein [soil metagenome]
MKVAVIGTGYVGLVTGTCLAETGNDVICVDNNPAKVTMLQNGGIPIYEPGLEELVKKNTRDGRLTFTSDLATAVRGARFIFIAVGTPMSKQGDADLSAVWAVSEAIGNALKDLPPGQPGDRVVIVKSTVPVGTNRGVVERLQAAGAGHVDCASNPEFLKEGAAINDFMKPDRVVVGVRHPAVGEALNELYKPFLRTERPFIVMSPESSEMTKYAANAMLATKISFINEMANLCDRVGANINDVRKGMGHDQRIGFQFLFPGPGYGGSCFPKDVQAIIAMGRRTNLPLKLMESVDTVNDAQKQVLFDKVKFHFKNDLKGKTIGIWGLAFKPQTDDIREAPALVLIDSLLAAGAKVKVHDPEAMANVKAIYGEKITFCEKPYEALDGVDGLALVTEWKEFQAPDFEQMKKLMKGHAIFDGRNIYDEKTMETLGFAYYGIGRGKKVY